MNEVISSLTRAVQAAPGDVPLRLHLAALLIEAGDREAAVSHCAAALQHDPVSTDARALMMRALAEATPAAPPPGRAGAEPPTTVSGGAVPAAPDGERAPAPAADGERAPAPTTDGERAPAPTTDGERAPAPAGNGMAVPDPDGSGFDWERAETDLGEDLPAPMFVDDNAAPDGGASAWDVERSTVTLADVGGMTQVKDRLEAAFLAPMRNPELRRLYGKSLRGGLLLYGPPGCGKTFIGRAVAGEMGAHFIDVVLSDVLDMYIGRSERNLADLFRLARSSAPVVVFLDEVDALGQRRTGNHSPAMRTIVNALLSELDGVSGTNEGVFVIGATNQPWEVDPALRRPGRLDRTLLVLPPDAPAREEIFRHHLAHRPVEGIDLGWLARHTEEYSGADIAHVCEAASELALMDGVRTGAPRLIGMGDLRVALGDVRPSTRPWFESARNVVQFANQDGTYDELRAYMRRRRL